MESKKPKSASIPRPNNQPINIDPNCPVCGNPLSLIDLIYNPDLPSDEIWYDEWSCVECNDGMVYFDWTPEEVDDFADQLELENFNKIKTEKELSEIKITSGWFQLNKSKKFLN